MTVSHLLKFILLNFTGLCRATDHHLPQIKADYDSTSNSHSIKIETHNQYLMG